MKSPPYWQREYLSSSACNDLWQGWPQGQLYIFAQVSEKEGRQLNRSKFCRRTDLIQGHVIELVLALVAAADVLKDQEDVRAIRAEDRAAITANTVHRI